MTEDDVDARLDAMKVSADVPERVAYAIWNDVTGRRGWKQASYTFDADVQMEILDTWTKLITEAWP